MRLVLSLAAIFEKTWLCALRQLCGRNQTIQRKYLSEYDNKRVVLARLTFCDQHFDVSPLS
jgi:hypothetical protein